MLVQAPCNQTNSISRNELHSLHKPSGVDAAIGTTSLGVMEIKDDFTRSVRSVGNTNTDIVLQRVFSRN